jgi:hypothetical protein
MSTSSTVTPTPFPVPSVHVLPWPDVVIDQMGVDPRSRYVERYWLGLLGPTATWLVRRLADGLDDSPDGFELDLLDTALELGLGARGGKHAPFMRTIERCCRFGATDLSDGVTLRARRKLPPLTRGQLAKLPQRMQADHDTWLEHSRPAAAPSPAPARSAAAAFATPSSATPTLRLAAPPSAAVGADNVRQRARQLALSLVELGEDGPTVERQLFRWQIHPAMAHEATGWAVAQHGAREAAREREARVAARLAADAGPEPA